MKCIGLWTTGVGMANTTYKVSFHVEVHHLQIPCNVCLQMAGASWEGLKQVAADVTQTVSDGVVAFAQGVSNLVAPLYEDDEDE